MLSRQLGNFVATLDYQSLPASVVEDAKTRILDLVASALAGVQLNTYQSLLPLVTHADEAPIWGVNRRTSLRDAVLVNSFLSHAAYLEDGSRFSGGHPSSTVTPAVLTLAGTRGASGQDVITAMIAGYEIFLRLGRVMYPAAVKRGFQPTAILGAVAAAGACANLLRLPPEQCANALSIACNFAAGLKEATKSPAIHPVQVAHSCHGGIVAALLAQAGERGAEAIFEIGFLPAYAGISESAEVVEGLGTQFCIGETYMKIHGGCRGNHAPTDVMLDLRRQHAITADQVREIHVSVDTVTYTAEIHHPKTGEQAQFSVAFCTSVALLDGHASIFQFSDKKLSDPDVQSLMDKTKVQIDVKLDEGYPNQRGAIIKVILNDGRELIGEIDNAKGEPEKPFSREDIEQKFSVLTSQILGDDEASVRQSILSLDQATDIRPLLEMIA